MHTRIFNHHLATAFPGPDDDVRHDELAHLQAVTRPARLPARGKLVSINEGKELCGRERAPGLGGFQIGTRL
jgi:hypothetical protein